MIVFFSPTFIWECTTINDTFRANMSTDKCVLKFSLPWDSRLPPHCTFVVRSLLIISSRDCCEADSRDTSPRHACLGEVSRKIWLHDFAINNNGGSVPVIFISLDQTQPACHPATQKLIAYIALRCYSNIDAKTSG